MDASFGIYFLGEETGVSQKHRHMKDMVELKVIIEAKYKR